APGDGAGLRRSAGCAGGSDPGRPGAARARRDGEHPGVQYVRAARRARIQDLTRPMNCMSSFAATLLLAALVPAAGLCEQKAVKPPPPPRNDVLPRGGARGGPRSAGGVLPKAGPRLTNPGSLAARLYKASPQERERALEKLPAAQQENIRKNLD